jgi:hypothetical protein
MTDREIQVTDFDHERLKSLLDGASLWNPRIRNLRIEHVLYQPEAAGDFAR